MLILEAVYAKKANKMGNEDLVNEDLVLVRFSHWLLPKV